MLGVVPPDTYLYPIYFFANATTLSPASEFCVAALAVSVLVPCSAFVSVFSSVTVLSLLALLLVTSTALSDINDFDT